MMDALHEPGVHTVVLMTSSQVGKTSILENIIAYHVTQDPAPLLMLMPTLEMAEAFSKDRLAPMARDTPAIKGLFSDPKSRDSGNTMLHKTYPGGHITLCGANSPASLASRPIRIVLCDEVDRYPPSAGTEGDPVNLAKKRTTTFWNRKLILTSTPTIKGTSRIELAYEQSDQRIYEVPCPNCGHYQALAWANITWESGKPETAKLHCVSCEVEIKESHKRTMLKAGVWRKQNSDVIGVAGFHINELYSPWRKWTEIAEDFLNSKDNPELLKTWVNTSLGETWEDSGDVMDTTGLLARREEYPAELPNPVCCLTAGVDVQDDRLEVYITGWGIGEECWFVDAAQIYGDPSRPQVWQELDEYLSRYYAHETGTKLGITATCIDSGGHHTQIVYDYCRTRAHRHIYATKGVPGEGRPLVSAPSGRRSGKEARKVPLYTIGVDDAKGVLFSRLKITHPGPGYLHIPTNHGLFGEEFVAQITAEKRVTKFVKGFPHREWVKTRTRNEALDCAILCMAALRILNPRLDALTKALNPVESAKKPPAPIRTRSGWAGRFRLGV